MMTAPNYRRAFPDFDYEIPALVADAEGWEDTSWHNDACPSFTCDVFVLWCDYADPTRREVQGGKRFTMLDEGRAVLETDAWDDVRAFIEDGRRDFPAPGLDGPAQHAACERVVSEAFNGAVRAIQDALGVEDGGFAGLWWDGEREAQVLQLLRDYYRAEARLEASHAD